MPKLLSASIKLTQKTTRANKNGEYPIYISVSFNGRKEKFTGVSCAVKHWDSKREEVKRSCPNYLVLNKTLSDLKNSVIERRNAFELANKKYTAAMLLEEDSIEVVNDNSFKSLKDSLISERRLAVKTSIRFKYAYNKLCEFIGKDDFIIDELTTAKLKDFSKWLKTQMKESSIKNILQTIASVWNYAIEKGVCQERDYPFKQFKINRSFKDSSRDYFLEESHIKRLYEYWLNLVIERNGNRWSYKDGAYDRLGKRTSEEFGILWFLLCYKLNGSAPIDVAKLKVSNCERTRIGEDEYWSINFKRQKTSVPVSIRWKRDMFCIITLEHFLGRSTNGLVYPIAYSTEQKKMLQDSSDTSLKAIRFVREAFRKINQDIIENNLENHSNEPLVEVDKVVMYTARHSYASHLLSKPNVSVRDLASLLGRSPNTIATYIHTLTKDEEIANLSSQLVI